MSSSEIQKSKEDKESKRTSLDFEVVQEGFYGTFPRGLVRLNNRAESEKAGLKASVIEGTDFEKHVLLLISSGMKNTGGYKVKINKLFQYNESGDLEVRAKDVEPGNSQICTMAITHPFTVVRFQKPSKPITNTIKLKWKVNSSDK